MRSREIFPLETRLGKLLLHGLHELIYEIVISLARDSFMTPAEILGIVEPFGVVGSDIQDDRERSRRVDTTDQAVQRKLSDRNSETACALIADAQNSLAVGYDNDIDAFVWPTSQDCRNGVTKRIRDKQSTRPPVNMTKLFAGQRNRRRIYQRRHFFNVIEKESIKKNFVCILERSQINVPFQVIWFSLESFIGAERLLIKCLCLRRKQAIETKLRALMGAERRAFVQ